MILNEKPKFMDPTATLRYVYLLQERDLARLGENTYKIRRSAQPRDGRIKGYPKGSHIIYMHPVKDHVKVEQEIKTALTQSFTQMRDYGVEYFQGDLSTMLRIIDGIVARDQESTGEINNQMQTHQTQFHKTNANNCQENSQFGIGILCSQTNPFETVTTMIAAETEINSVDPVVESHKTNDDDTKSQNIDTQKTLESPASTHTCKFCEKDFCDKSTYNRHTKKSKKACITQQKCVEIFDKLNRLQFLERKSQMQKEALEKTEKENQLLKELLTKTIAQETLLKDSVKDIIYSIEQVKNTVATSATTDGITNLSVYNNTHNTTNNDRGF